MRRRLILPSCGRQRIAGRLLSYAGKGRIWCEGLCLSREEFGVERIKDESVRDLEDNIHDCVAKLEAVGVWELSGTREL